MKKILLSFFALFAIAVSQAQCDETLFGSKGLGLTGFWGGPTTSLNNFQESFRVNDGHYFVFEFGKDFLIGWDRFNYEGVLEDDQSYEMRTKGLMVGYAPGSHNKVHAIFSLYGGRANVDLEDNQTDKILITQPSVGVEVNIFRWMRLGVDFGYRFATNTSFAGYTDKDFSSPYTGLKLKFGWSWGR
jgi:hypothetical protein